MKKKRSLSVSLTALILLSFINASCTPTPKSTYLQNGEKTKQKSMQWWQDAKFGMFIHWGPYSNPAGIWKGKKICRYSEWIMANANIPKETYQKEIVAEFNPVKFDAEKWVLLAKKAGMKYLVITTKHHDGFCLFDSNATDYDITDASPYKKDVIKKLSDECTKKDIKFCTYYSILDWHHPDQQLNFNAIDEKISLDETAEEDPWTEDYIYGLSFDQAFGAYGMNLIKKGKKQHYIEYAKAQLKELIENYHTNLIWFDGTWMEWWDIKDGHRLRKYLHSLKPDIIVNDRIAEDESPTGAGDYSTSEQVIPKEATSYPWETNMTMNTSFGYKSWDDSWKSTTAVIHNLVDVVSKGGNYLLNIGPKGDGTIPQASIDRLRNIGNWMKTNGESIYAAKPGPFENLPWGRSTAKINPDGSTNLYLHIFYWPKDNLLYVPGITQKPRNTYMLAKPRKTLDVTVKNSRLLVKLPGKSSDLYLPVLAMDFQEKIPETIKGTKLVRQFEDGSVNLTPLTANIQSPGGEAAVCYETDKPVIGEWYNKQEKLNWKLNLRKPGKFDLYITYAQCIKPGTIYQLEIGKQTLKGKVKQTIPWGKYITEHLGSIKISEPGIRKITLKPLEIPTEGVMKFKSITLKPKP